MELQSSRFESLGAAFYTRLGPQPLADPYWVGCSPAAVADLGLPAAWPHSAAHLAQASGNALAPGASPLASVYSGHQFGVWAGQLGDGRALLLGERAGPEALWEVQLKGSGLTPYSRMGDGRAVLRSSIREFLCSEAMHALGVPSTRALCITGSPTAVRRERIETAAVVTRLAPSFIRFGHFEHFSRRGLHAELRALTEFVIEHHYPDCAAWPQPAQRSAALLAAVTRRTAELLAQWQALGFCHGVMNTDNMSILGLTIDYGPFQFMDGFDPQHICNHSDDSGRYAWAQQPRIAHWNLYCLAQALLPLLDDPQQALAALQPFESHFAGALQQRLNAKLGLSELRPDDAQLSDDLLRLLADERADFTWFWRCLSDGVADYAHSARVADLGPARAQLQQTDAFDAWAQRWRTRLCSEAAHTPAQARALMRRSNPRLVLRNHLAQAAIEAAEQRQFEPLQRLQAALAQPYDDLPDCDDLAAAAPDWAAQIVLSCSS